MKRPLAIITVSLIIGIILSEIINGIILMVISFLFILLFTISGDKQKCIIVISIMVGLVYTNIFYKLNAIPEEYINNENNNIIGRIIEIKEKEYYIEYDLDKVYIEKNKMFKTSLKLRTSDKYELGDIIILKGNIELPTEARNKGGFDYRKTLLSENVYGIVEPTSTPRVISKNNINVIWRGSIFLRDKINQIIDKLLIPPESDIVKGILIGDISDLENEVYEDYKEAGMMHLLAVSGGNIAFLNLIFIWILKKLKLRKDKINIIMILIIILYVYITGMTASIVRAGIMAITILVAYLVNRKSDTITAIAFSAILMIINNPFVVWSLGFQLSFLGTLGIVLLYKPIKEFLDKYMPEKLSELVGVSLAAQLVVNPILAYNFNTFSIVSIFSNILAVPLSGIILTYGIITVAVGAISNTIGQLCAGGLYILTKAIVIIAKISASLPFGNIIVRTPKLYEIVFYFVIIFAVFGLIKLSKKTKQILVVSFLGITLVGVIIPKPLTIDFIDVGHGDSILITHKNKTILIDTGGSYISNGVKYDMGESRVAPFILDKGIKNIDLLILSHLDEDHFGGLQSITEMLDVDVIMLGDTQHEEEKYKELVKTAKKEKAELVKLKAPKKFKLDDIDFDIINPFGESIDENNDSLAIMMEYKNKKVLFTGDMEKEAEKRLLEKGINLQADILKVGHHGSGTSTTKEFVEAVKPEYTIISVGTRFKSIPSKDVLGYLQGSKVYRTDRDGGITVKIDNEIIVDTTLNS